MINIDDIRKRLEKYPIPREVSEVRDIIVKRFSNLTFYEDGHIYTLKTPEGTVMKIPSVSEIIHRFEPKSDWDSITERYAAKNGMTVPYVKRMWKEANLKSTNSGTLTHMFGENYMRFCLGDVDGLNDRIRYQYENGYLIPYSEKEIAIAKFYEDMMKENDIFPVMPEACVHMGVEGTIYPECMIYAGTFDMLFARVDSGGKVKLILDDWKTNKSLENDYNRNYGKTLCEPFADMINEPMSIYTLQLSAYQMCLNQIDMDVIERNVVWLKENGEYEKIPTKDVTDRLLSTLKKD